MINKNAFGVVQDAPCSRFGITYPGAFSQSEPQYLPIKIDKKNADVKSPPKYPFTVQVALKSSLDIFYFTIPCELHTLINRDVELTQDEFKKFWDMITPDKTFTLSLGPGEMYQGLRKMPQDMNSLILAQGFKQMPQNGQFGAKTVNNLPLIFEIQHNNGIQITYKVPVLPLKPLFEMSLKYIFAQRN